MWYVKMAKIMVYVNDGSSESAVLKDMSMVDKVTQGES